MPTANKHWVSDLWKNKYVKIPIIISLWALLLLVLFIVGKVLFGFNVNLFGVETNPPKKKDTVTITNYVEVPIKKDSPTLILPDRNIKSKPIVVVNNVLPSKKDTMQKVQSTVTGDNNKTVVGNNSGIVGDVTINNGSPQRHLTEQYANMIIKRLEDTLKANNLSSNVLIEFGSTMGSDESLVFTNEVANFLFSKGYTNISHNVGPTLGNSSLRILYNDKKIFIDVGQKPPK